MIKLANTSPPVSELAVWALTICVGVSVGLEYGIAAGAAADALRALAAAARPHLQLQLFKVASCVAVRSWYCRY